MNDLTPHVLAFARLMQAKLNANQHKGGWQDETESWLMARLEEEVAELKTAIDEGMPPSGIALEAADVANFAMMIADNIQRDSRQVQQ